MAAKRRSKAGDAARQIREHPIVGRLLDDADLRDSIRSAYESSHKAYSRLSASKGPSALLDDKKLHKELQRAADSLREASDLIRKPKKRRGGGFGKLIVVTFVGGVAAIALSEGLRTKLLDMLFGAEEEFDYSATTTSPATPAPTPESPASQTVEAAVPDEAAEASSDGAEADSEATTTSS